MEEFTLPADIRIVGPQGVFCFIHSAWERALTMAIDFGWEPEHRPVHYVLDIGLSVSDADAMGLADALDTMMRKTSDAVAIQLDRDKWEDLITFCRAGGFQILSC